MIFDLFGWLMDPSGLTPHGFCLLWEPGLIWTYASADLVIGAAYFTIPIVLIIFIRRRRDVAFQPLFWLFAAFILLCGVTHWLDLVTLWVPAYGLQAVAKAATALASVVTTIALWRLLPAALALPSPAQLQTANDALRKAVAELARQAELQAEAAEREMAIFRNSVDTLFVVRVEETASGPEFVFETASPSSARLTGWDPDQLVGRRPDQCLPAELADVVVRRYRRCVAERVSVAFEETFVTPLGTKEMEGSITPVPHPTTGRIVRIVGTIRDVTERRRTEAALRQAQRLEVVGSLSAGVAHDFNNILQTVVGGLEMILEEVGEQTPAHNFAGVALKSAMRGASLTHHLLSYARKQMLRPQVVEVALFLTEMQTLLGRTLGPHIAIHIDADRRLSVFADSGQLGTALLNLAINASHAMPQGGTLRMNAREKSHAGQTWIVLAVADSGTGMDAATLAKAVEPFFSTKGPNGSGLGLSMVQGFVEQSGGSFSIVSAPGQGTTVEICLPAAATEDQCPEAPATPTTRQGTGRILLVDDATDVLVTTSAFLERSGFVVTRAQSGDEALALLTAGEPFDVLVSDYAMPGLNGADLIAEARLVQPGLRALMMTGYSGIENADALAEPVSVLHKPFKRAELAAEVHRLMKPERNSPGEHVSQDVDADMTTS